MKFRLLLLLFVPVFASLALAKPATSQNIMISAEGPHSVEAGINIADAGGNIVDVAVATAFAMAVELPQSGSLGGGGFAVIYFDGKAYSLDYREMAPQAMSPTYYLNKEKDASITGGAAVGVPGVVAGLHALHKKFGKLKWRQVIQPAIDLAENGFAVNTEMHEIVGDNMKRFNYTGKKILTKDDKPLLPGEVIKQDQLANVLRRIRSGGRDAFYKGDVAMDIEKSVKTYGGDLTGDDLARYKVRWLEPIEMDYEGHKVFSMPPPSSGGVVLKTALALTEAKKLRNYPPRSSVEAHLIGEILSRSFRGRAFLADPEFVVNPIDTLTSDEYIKEQAATIGLAESRKLPPLQITTNRIRSIPSTTSSTSSTSSTSTSTSTTTVPTESDETTHLSIIDSKGNAIAMTTTLNGNFGSGVFSNRFAISLNNEMDDFTTRPGEPNMFGLIQGEENTVEAGKRPLSSMTPTVAVRDDKAVLSLGARGGPRIISAVFQVLHRVLVNEYDIDLAIQTPRVHHQYLPHKLMHDKDRVSPDVLRSLKEYGHELVEKDVAKVFGVNKTKDGLLQGGFDSRGHGKAAGL